MSQLIRAAAVQTNPELGNLRKNCDHVIERLREAAAAGAGLVVFPECALTGYIFTSRDEARQHAETVPGPSIDRISSVCRALGVSAVVGMIETQDEHLFNAAVLVRPDGSRAVYRKVHLPFMGVDRFVDPGDRAFQVHEAGGLRVGLHICYDGAFPEPGRVLTLRGADVLVLPTNWPAGAEAIAEHVIPCRAIENVVWGIAAGRVGTERSIRFIGGSCIVSPLGVIVARASGDAEEIIYGDIDVNRARDKRIVRKPGEMETNRIKDRRPDFYGAILESS